MPFWKWSHTGAANASADSTVNWAEGMAPSAVNDSARAMMARLAEWRDDISGTIVTAGTSTAYTLATNQGFDNLPDMNGAMIAFVPHVTNGATVTITVDGLTARPLRSAPGVELTSGIIVQGTPYVATYNNSDGAFYLQGFTVNPYVIPVGGLLPYVGATAPNSAFVLPFGQAISRTTYATLFNLVGGTFGGGDGSTTFNVPDLRGRAVFGQDNMGGSAAGRITGAGGNFNGGVLGNTGGAENQTLTQAQLPVVTPTFTGQMSSFRLSGDPGTGFTANDGSTTSVQQGSPGAGVMLAQAHLINLGGVNVTPSGTISSFGSGNSHPILSPAMTLPYILRII
jgi:microcystin-dependent protein